MKTKSNGEVIPARWPMVLTIIVIVFLLASQVPPSWVTGPLDRWLQPEIPAVAERSVESMPGANTTGTSTLVGGTGGSITIVGGTGASTTTSGSVIITSGGIR